MSQPLPDLVTPAEVAAAIKEIAANVCDFEAAHAMEDELMRRVLFTISVGTPDAQELATLAMASFTIGFHRVCA